MLAINGGSRDKISVPLQIQWVSKCNKPRRYGDFTFLKTHVNPFSAEEK
jgi:hypothetical protein